MKLLLATALLVLSSTVAQAQAEDVESDGEWATVRLTYYLESGVTYSGEHTYAGSTACSWNYPLGTRFVLPEGEEFVCNDRGMLGWNGWLDLWRRPDIARKYGAYVTVEVLR